MCDKTRELIRVLIRDFLFFLVICCVGVVWMLCGCCVGVQKGDEGMRGSEWNKRIRNDGLMKLGLAVPEEEEKEGREGREGRGGRGGREGREGREGRGARRGDEGEEEEEE
jgi:hypothetical protein